MKQTFPFNDRRATVLAPADYLDDGREGAELIVALAQAIEDEAIEVIVVDFQEVIDIEPNVLDVLARVHCSCRLRHRSLRLANTNQIDRRLQAVGLDAMFTIRLSVKEALYG